MISLVSVLCQCNGVFSYSVAVSIISRGHQSTGKKHQVTGKLYHIFFYQSTSRHEWDSNSHVGGDSH